PRDIPDFLNMLTAERRVRSRDRKGQTRIEWKKVSEHRRNEAWDCMVYALAAAHSLVIAGLRMDDALAVRPRPTPVKPPRPEPDPSPVEPAAARSDYRFQRNRVEPPSRPVRVNYWDRRSGYFNPRIDDDDD
ncbi:MAG TPA: phage terminase large subunit family protein, partial [Myxococcota bacterium]|nr:phage terminase large subunit family protein [Myxococcota bacterium]